MFWFIEIMKKLKPIIPTNVEMITKKTISKKEAIDIADRVKSGMSIKVMNDIEELKSFRSKVLQEIQS